jgi:hypothetical protein
MLVSAANEPIGQNLGWGVPRKQNGGERRARLGSHAVKRSSARENTGQKRLFESPRVADLRSSRDLDNAIIPTSLDDLAIETGWPKDATNNFLVKKETVCGDQRGHVQESFG